MTSWPTLKLLLIGICSISLVLLHPGLAYYGVYALYILPAALLAFWIYRDSIASGGRAIPWAIAAFLLWPLVIPIRLFRNLGLRGLFRVLGVLLIFILPQAGYLGSVGLNFKAATTLIKKGEALLENAQKGGDKKNTEEALKQFQAAFSTIHDPKGGFFADFFEYIYLLIRIRGYSGIFDTAHMSGRFSAVDTHYDKFCGLRQRLTPTIMILWHCIAVKHQSNLFAARIAAARHSLLRGDATAHVKALREMRVSFDEVIELRKDRDILFQSMSPQKQQKQTDSIKYIKKMHGIFDMSIHSAICNLLDKLDRSPEWGQAFANHVKGTAEWETRENAESAIQYLNQAVEMRSDFGDPYMLLSDIYLSYRRNDLASKAALKAISLVEHHGAHGMMPKKMMLAEIHSLNGKAMYRWGLDLARSPKRKKRASAGRYFQTARRELQTALELNPESPQGLELRKEMAAGGF